MDAIDMRILKAHQSAPDLSMMDLAETIGLSHTACWKRLKRMEREGYIAGRAVLLNPKALGFGVTVIVQIKIENHRTTTIDAFERSIQELPEILDCYTLAGDSDFLLRLVVRSIEDYELFLKEKLANLPHVASVNSSFALRTVKNSTALPL